MHKEKIIPSQPQYIPYLKITPSNIIGYYQYQGPKRKSWQKFLFGSDLMKEDDATTATSQKRYTGEITKGSRKRLAKCCELLFAISRKKKVKSPKTGIEFSFRIGLITLTLSGKQNDVTDKEIKAKLLAPFLRHFKVRGLKNYIWKAERQSNGNLHFHILTDCFVHYQDVRDYWNYLQAQFGWIEDFYNEHGHRSPNSTDVKSVHQESGMASYMLKYMLKNAEKEKREADEKEIDATTIGKVWDCSLNLKLPNNTADVLEDWQFDAMESKLDSGYLVEVTCDYCKVFVPGKVKMSKAAPKFLLDRLLSYLKEVVEYERSSKVDT